MMINIISYEHSLINKHDCYFLSAPRNWLFYLHVNSAELLPDLLSAADNGIFFLL